MDSNQQSATELMLAEIADALALAQDAIQALPARLHHCAPEEFTLLADLAEVLTEAGDALRLLSCRASGRAATVAIRKAMGVTI